MKYFVKVAKKKKNSGLYTGLGFGALSGAASVTSAHPIEHKLYGNKATGGFFKHLGSRLGKGMLASSVGYGTYYYLTHNEKRIKDWARRARAGRNFR